jgi:hypothetical protein
MKTFENTKIDARKVSFEEWVAAASESAAESAAVWTAAWASMGDASDVARASSRIAQKNKLIELIRGAK